MRISDWSSDVCSSDLPHPAFCACCTPGVAPAPRVLFNRPGLSALQYRIGTFGSFRAAMLQAIAAEPALSALTTRESDDYAITILELWAAVGDGLTFYQERTDRTSTRLNSSYTCATRMPSSA